MKTMSYKFDSAVLKEWEGSACKLVASAYTTSDLLQHGMFFALAYTRCYFLELTLRVIFFSLHYRLFALAYTSC